MRMTNQMQAALYWARKHVRFGPNVSAPLVPAGTGWVIGGTDATHIVTFGTGTMRIQSNNMVPTLAIAQTGIMTAGKIYDITVVCSIWVVGSIKTDSFVGGPIILAAGLGTVKFRSVAATGFSMTQNVANVDLTLSSIEIREVTT